MLLNNSLYISHKYLELVVKTGDKVIDATCGNGNDTLFLSNLVGENGKVIGFDIQDAAIENTKARLLEFGSFNNATIIKSGHENMKDYVDFPVKAVVFNFGYLPKGDHKIATRPETSIAAIEAAMDLIVPGGIVMMVLYYGGDSGFSERDALLDYFKTIDHKKFAVLSHTFINQPNCPPIAVCIEKY